MSELILALDTTGSHLNMGLSNGADIHQLESLPLGKALSTDLHMCLQEFMGEHSWSDLDAIAIIVGPGSYTGSRIGVVTARTLAQSLDISIYGFTSLEVAAAISCQKPGKVAIAIPAQRNHIYGAIYEIDAESAAPICLQPEKNLNFQAWENTIQEFSDPLRRIDFEYHEDSSEKMLEYLLRLGREQLISELEGGWQNVFPNYAKP